MQRGDNYFKAEVMLEFFEAAMK